MKFRPILLLPILSLAVSVVILSQQCIRKATLEKNLKVAKSEYNKLEPVYTALVKMQPKR